MRPQGYEFVQYVKVCLPGFFIKKKILDVGSSLHNNESHFQDCEYYITDVTKDNNSSTRSLISAKDLDFSPEFFHCIVCTECLEFDNSIEEAVKNMYHMLKSNGLFLVTFQKNSSLDENLFNKILNLDQSFSLWNCYLDKNANDILFCGIKNGNALPPTIRDYTNEISRLKSNLVKLNDSIRDNVRLAYQKQLQDEILKQEKLKRKEELKIIEQKKQQEKLIAEKKKKEEEEKIKLEKKAADDKAAKLKLEGINIGIRHALAREQAAARLRDRADALAAKISKPITTSNLVDSLSDTLNIRNKNDDNDDTVIYLDNSNNSSENNSPGFNIWVGGKHRGDITTGAVRLEKTDTNVPIKINSSVLVNDSLLTWYYTEGGWYSWESLFGPFKNGQTISIPKVVINERENKINLIEKESTLSRDKIYDQLVIEEKNEDRIVNEFHEEVKKNEQSVNMLISELSTDIKNMSVKKLKEYQNSDEHELIKEKKKEFLKKTLEEANQLEEEASKLMETNDKVIKKHVLDLPNRPEILTEYQVNLIKKQEQIRKEAKLADEALLVQQPDLPVEDPSVEDPSLEDPSVEDPSLEEPSVEDPSLEDPSVEDPSLEDPSVEDPSIEVKEELPNNTEQSANFDTIKDEIKNEFVKQEEKTSSKKNNKKGRGRHMTIN